MTDLGALPALLSTTAIAALAAAAAVLLALVIADYRYMVLPDSLVLALAALGLGFHLATHWIYRDPMSLGIGAVVGAGVPWLLREAYWRFRRLDALGLGDVKLLGAAGLWVGWESLGLLVCVGVAVHLGERGARAWRTGVGGMLAAAYTEVPFGPGLCAGLVCAVLGLLMTGY